MGKIVRCLFALLLGAALFGCVTAGAETGGEDGNTAPYIHFSSAGYNIQNIECMDGHE